MRMMRYATLMILVGLLMIGVAPVFGQCDTTNGADDVTCSTDVATFDGQGGADTLVVADGTTVDTFAGGNGADTMTNNGAAFGMEGDGGDDTMTNNGLVFTMDGNGGSDTMTNNGDAFGMVGGNRADTMTNNGSVFIMDGGDGRDTMINNGTVVVMFGEDRADTMINNGEVDFLDGGAGHDTMINNGVVVEDMYGDDGRDTMTNNGTIEGNMEGEGGRDTMINAGVVEGDLLAGAKDDIVVLQTGAVVEGMVDGGNGSDTLVFNIEVGAEYIEETARQIAAANPDGGTITINGIAYTWTDFEGLVSLLQMAMFHDARLNAFDFAATAVVYCADDISGVSMYTVGGELAGTATLEEIYAAPVGGTVTSGLGISLNWLGDASALLVGPDGYSYVFNPAVCAVN